MKTKPTEKSALMSAIYAAGCGGWILPHHPGGGGGTIPQVEAQTGAVQKSQPNIHSILQKLKFCSPF